MIYEITVWLESIPVICLIGLCYGLAFLLLPIGQFVEYRIWVKKYGKEMADELARRY